MAAEKSKMIRLGLFVVIALVFFVIGIYNVGSKKNLFGSTIEISAQFKNINGLLAGNNVRYSGMVVGSVSSINIENDSLLVVHMNIDNALKTHIRKNALVSISSNGLVGEKIINITPITGSFPHIENNDVLQSEEAVEMNQVLSILDKSNKNIFDITNELKDVITKINDDNSLITRLLADDGIPSRIKKTTGNFETLSEDLLAMSEEIDKALSDLNEGKGTLGFLLKDSSFEIKANQLLDDLDENLISKTSPIMDDLQSASHSVHSISYKVDSLINKVDLDESLLGLLIQDSVSAEKTKSILDSFQVSTHLFNENMEALKHNIFLRRYFKKKKKKEQKLLSQK